ncbi:hypothetical protein GOB57_24950 [Sinorhizobium meliloti]|nr:hypothetical protein [Sinorhizobium meliloti]
MTNPTRTDDHALDAAFLSYRDYRTPGYNPRSNFHHFDGFRVFADSVIGDALRKIKVHLFPKLETADADGVAIGSVSIIPCRANDGTLYELLIRAEGVDRFVLRTLRTPPRRDRNRSTETVVVLRAGAQLGITHSSLLAQDEAHKWWRYKVHDGPGAVPGLVEFCELIRPFIAREVAADTTSKELDPGYAPEYMELVERDGGLPGSLVARFGELVIADGMGAIFDWIATELPLLVSKLGDRMTWPENSLHYNDQDESASILRAPGAIGIVQFVAPSMQDPHYASMQVLRLGHEGETRRAETYLIPVGDGDLVRAIEAFRAGEPIGSHPSMAFDYTTRSVTTSAAFLEAKRYQDVGATIYNANFDWKGHREADFVEGVDRFLEWDGFAETDPMVPPSTRSL